MRNRVELLFKNKPNVYIEYFEDFRKAHRYFDEQLKNNPLVAQAILYYNYEGKDHICCLTPQDLEYEEEDTLEEEEYEYTYEDYLEDTRFEEYYYGEVKA